MENPTIKIIITEDLPKWRETAKEFLKDYNIHTIAMADEGSQLLKLLETHDPDVILLDLKMPGMDGNVTFDRLKKMKLHNKVIITSMFDDPTVIEDFMNRGVRGYINKDYAANPEVLVSAIRIVHMGGKYTMPLRRESALKFTNRNREVMSLIAEKKSRKEIADELGISTSGIIKQERKIMRMLGLEHYAALCVEVVSRGFKFLGRHRNKDV